MIEVILFAVSIVCAVNVGLYLSYGLAAERVRIEFLTALRDRGLDSDEYMLSAKTLRKQREAKATGYAWFVVASASFLAGSLLVMFGG